MQSVSRLDARGTELEVIDIMFIILGDQPVVPCTGDWDRTARGRCLPLANPGPRAYEVFVYDSL